MRLQITPQTSVVASLVCVAALAAMSSLSAQESPDLPAPDVLEAARRPTPVVDDAVSDPLSSDAFVKVAAAPMSGNAGSPVFVDFRQVERNTVSAKSVDRPWSHRQGGLDGDVSQSIDLQWVEAPDHEVNELYFAEPTPPRQPVAEKAAGDWIAGWEGISFTGEIPADTQLAVGPEYVVEAVNSGFMVFTKTGTAVGVLNGFESFLPLPVPWDGTCFGPRVVYSVEHGNFVMSVMGLDTTNLKSYYWLMASDTDDPTGGWWIVRIDSSAGAAGSEEWLDDVAIGVDTWGVYVTGNYFSFGGSFQRSKLWSFDPQVMSGAEANYYFWDDLKWPDETTSAFAVRPALPHTVNGSGSSFYVNSHPDSGTELCLWFQSGKRYPGSSHPDEALLGNVAISSQSYFAMGNNVEQPGSMWDIDGGDTRILNAVYTSARVYAAMTRSADASLTKSEAYIAVLRTTGSMAWERVVTGSPYNIFYPALTLEGSELYPDEYVVFSMTEPLNGTTGFAGVASFIFDKSGEADVHFGWEKNGEGPYSLWDGGSEGVGLNRWGDYAGASWDWTCNHAWGAAEYATDSSTWNTWISARALGDNAPCQYFHVTSPNGGETVTAGTSAPVTWETMNIPPTDEVHILLYDGADWVSLAGPLASTTTSYSALVPNTPTSQAKIMVGSQPAGGGDFKVFDTSDAPFTIVGLPDLEPSLLNPAASYDAGGTYSVFNSVVNNGPVAAASFVVELRLSLDTTCTTDDTLIGSRTVSSLAALATDSTSTSVTIPPGQAGGTYSLCQLVDPQGAVAEIDETNNIAYESVEIVQNVIFWDSFESGDTTAWSSTVP